MRPRSDSDNKSYKTERHKYCLAFVWQPVLLYFVRWLRMKNPRVKMFCSFELQLQNRKRLSRGLSNPVLFGLELRLYCSEGFERVTVCKEADCSVCNEPGYDHTLETVQA